MRTVLILCLAALTSGCLFTREPVFDAANSVAPADLPAFDAWRTAAEAYDWAEGEEKVPMPVPFYNNAVDEGPAADLRLVALPGGAILVQEQAHGCSDPHCVAYYLLRYRDGGVPEICFYDTYNEQNLEAAAMAAGVNLTTIATNDDKLHLPPDIGVGGPPETVRAFLMERFTSGPLFCEAAPIGDEIPSRPSP